MNKRSFTYRNRKFILIWTLLISIPFIIFMTDGLDFLDDKTYFVVNIIGSLAGVFFIWKIIDFMPGIKSAGYYWKENGRTIIEYDGKTTVLNQVEEIFLCKNSIAHGVNIRIRNYGKKIELLSEMLKDDEDIRDTAFYTIFHQLLAENPELVQEKDIHGELIEYWYKKR